jgi:hypothetical protein
MDTLITTNFDRIATLLPSENPRIVKYLTREKSRVTSVRSESYPRFPRFPAIKDIAIVSLVYELISTCERG